MAKKRINSTPKLTLQEQKELMISKFSTNDEYDRLREPSYIFDVGDEVSYGGFSRAVVEYVFMAGKVYLLHLFNKVCPNPYSQPDIFEYEESYQLVPWVKVRKLDTSDKVLTDNKTPKICFMNNSISSLLNRYYFFGVNMHPDYQRAYVWSAEDKEYLIDSIFKGYDIGKFVFVELPSNEYLKKKVSFEILDGKQRLTTLIDFYEDRFQYNGLYFSDLSNKDKSTFLNHKISVGEIEYTNYEDILNCFLALNRSGKQIDLSHIQYVEDLLNESKRT